MRKPDFVFDSEVKQTYQLASGYISETLIFFEQENVYAQIQAKGHVDLLDAQGNVQASKDLPPEEGGKAVYQEVICRTEGGRIILEFPTYEWIDNYPHCDGEHDRWDTRRIGEHILEF